MNSFEQSLIDNGFTNLQEFSDLVSKVDISTYINLLKFKEWQNEDGTKLGLLQLKIKDNK
jgi:hypothetical protein